MSLLILTRYTLTMFHGSLPSDVQRILAEAVKLWNPATVYVGCSGNFTVERALASIGKYDLHGNDVTIYSSVLGSYLAGQSFELMLKPDTPFPWLEEYMDTQERQVATVSLATRLVDSMRSSGDKKLNAYYERMDKAYRQQFSSLHEKTVKRLRDLSMRLASYFHGDVLDFIDQVPSTGTFVVYPPFYAGDYTNMFKKLDILFEWQRPTFKELNDELLAGLYAKVASKRNWLFGTDTPQQDYKDHLIGLARTTNRGVPMYLYASHGNKRIVTPNQAYEVVNNARLTPGMTLGSKISITVLSYKQFQALRSQYMNIFIRPGQATEAYGVMVDGYLVGVFAVSVAPNPGAYHEVSQIYMLSDFAVSPTNYPRLSKLVLYAALSTEAKLLYERVAKHRVTKVYTTAFSDHAESMKYRGIFKLANRTENHQAGMEDDPHYGRKYVLNYVAKSGQWTLSEGYALWQKKHGQRSEHANQNNND